MRFASPQPPPPQTNAHAPVLDAVRTVVQRALNEQRLVGAVVLVLRDGTPIHRQAAGFADRETGRAMAPDTLFRLASVSKPIVSTAALALVAQGKLDLDADIRQWLPDFQPEGVDGRIPVITVRQLLSHTAGLGYRFFEASEEGPYARAQVSDGMDASGITLAENLQRIASVPLSYAPGTGWAYSLATDVLGALIARVLNVSLDDAVRALVTTPLGMSDTGFTADEPQRMAVPYVSDTPAPHRLSEGEVVPVIDGTVGARYSPRRIFDPTAYPSGGAGMVGSAEDFVTLLETLRLGGDPLVTSALVDEMSRDQSQGRALADTPGWGFGLGYSVLIDRTLAATPESNGTWRWGGAYGHSWWVDREKGLSVVALTNTLYEGMSGRFVTELRDAVYHAVDIARTTA